MLAFGAGIISGALAGALLQGFDLLGVSECFLGVIETALQDAAPSITDNSGVKELCLHAKLTCKNTLNSAHTSPAVLCYSSPGTESQNGFQGKGP